MTLLLDTSGILAALFEDQNRHHECAEALLAEASGVMRRHAGAQAEQMFLEEVERGAYELAPFERREIAAARQAASRYNVGLATASLVVIGDRDGQRRVLTLHRNSFPKRFRGVPDL